MRHLTLLILWAATLAAQSYRAEILAGPGEVREGPARETQLRGVGPLALSASGDIVFSDFAGRRIWRVTTGGRLELVAGSDAGLVGPRALAFDAAGNLYFVDGNYIRRIDAGTGDVSRFAGNGLSPFVENIGDGGPALRAAIAPSDLAFDARGDLYFADNNRIRRIAMAAGIVTTFAGGGSGSGCDDCPATQAVLGLPRALAFDRAGNLWIADNLTALRRVEAATGRISTPLRSGVRDADGIPASEASWRANDLVFDGNGDLLLAEGTRVRRIAGGSATGLISTVTGLGSAGPTADGVPAAQASYGGLAGIAVRPNGDLLLSDAGHGQIRVLAGGVVRTLAGTGRTGRSAVESVLASPIGAAVAADRSVVVTSPLGLRFRGGGAAEDLFDLRAVSSPVFGDVEPDRQGNVFVQLLNGGLMRVTAAGTPTLLSLGVRTSFALDAAGNVIYGDLSRGQLARVNPATGSVTPLVVNTTPIAVAVDARDRVPYVDGNGLFRVDAPLSPPVRLNGPLFGRHRGDGGPVQQAELGNVADMAADSRGNLFLMDLWQLAVRRVNADGIITTVVGREWLSRGSRITVDPDDNLIVTNPETNVVYRFRPVTPAMLASVPLAGPSRRAGSPTAWSVAVRNADGTPASGVPVDFAISSGGGSLSVPRAWTGNDGVATVTLTAPSTAGRVVLRATSGSLDAVTHEVDVVEQPPADVPAINPGGVVSAGLFNRIATLSPGGIATVFGAGFAAEGSPVRRVGAADLVEGRVPTNFAGVCVHTGAVLAPVFAVAPGQVNFQVPALPPGGPAVVRVIRNCGTPSARESEPVPVDVLWFPEFFHFQDRFVAAIDAVSGAFLGPAGLLPGATFTPARPGQLVTLFGTGFGPTSPAVAPGEIPTRAAPVETQFNLLLGGVVVPPGDITYFGLAPFNPGLYQVNFRVPDNLAPGEYRISGSGSVLVVGER